VQQDENGHAVLTAKFYCTFVCFADLFQSILMYSGQRLKRYQRRGSSCILRFHKHLKIRACSPPIGSWKLSLYRRCALINYILQFMLYVHSFGRNKYFYCFTVTVNLLYLQLCFYCHTMFWKLYCTSFFFCFAAYLLYI
jgi:hypothetical protein